MHLIAMDDPHLLSAPYVWRHRGQGSGARITATMPGAYLRFTISGSTTVQLLIDGAVNAGCPADSRPVLEFSIDYGPFLVVALTEIDHVYPLTLTAGLDPAAPHRVDCYFRAADLTQQRWTSSRTHLCLAGVLLEEGGTVCPMPARPGLAIGFGDSITEGVGVDGLFTSWQHLAVNNARCTWFPIVSEALGCEYGQVGSGGQGMVVSRELPALHETWGQYDAAASRLTDGCLLPAPDYVFCNMGTNDFDCDITEEYTRWLHAVRAACAQARIYAIAPLLGWHSREIAHAVRERQSGGDAQVWYIDTSPFHAAYSPDHATRLAYDGVHPNLYGNALFAAHILTQVMQSGR